MVNTGLSTKDIVHALQVCQIVSRSFEAMEGLTGVSCKHIRINDFEQLVSFADCGQFLCVEPVYEFRN